MSLRQRFCKIFINYSENKRIKHNNILYKIYLRCLNFKIVYVNFGALDKIMVARFLIETSSDR